MKGFVFESFIESDEDDESEDDESVDSEEKDGNSLNYFVCKNYIHHKLLQPLKFLRKHKSERAAVLDLLTRTVRMGESNSALVIGPRGSGKTSLVESVLEELEICEDDAAVVNLHGVLHTDDRHALKDVTRQLKLENVVGDKVFGTFADNLSFLLQCLKTGDKESTKPILFILKDFDLFCSHRNQTLLYNLFDVAQSAQAPLCVLGITCRLDVIELLEKRVKSRFSHRQIFILNDHTFEEYTQFFKTLLTLPPELVDPVFTCLWNEQIEALANNPAVLGILKRHYDLDKRESALKLLLGHAMLELSKHTGGLVTDDILKAHKHLTMDGNVGMMEGLSVLGISLVIAMKQLTEIYDGDPFNFQLVLRRYHKFAQHESRMKKATESVVFKMFEHLENLELIQPIKGKTKQVEKEYQLYQLLVTSQQVMEAVKKYDGLPTDVSQWAASTAI